MFSGKRAARHEAQIAELHNAVAEARRAATAEAQERARLEDALAAEVSRTQRRLQAQSAEHADSLRRGAVDLLAGVRQRSIDDAVNRLITERDEALAQVALERHRHELSLAAVRVQLDTQADALAEVIGTLTRAARNITSSPTTRRRYQKLAATYEARLRPEPQLGDDPQADATGDDQPATQGLS